jgi:hypothetical protein
MFNLASKRLAARKQLVDSLKATSEGRKRDDTDKLLALLPLAGVDPERYELLASECQRCDALGAEAANRTKAEQAHAAANAAAKEYAAETQQLLKSRAERQQELNRAAVCAQVAHNKACSAEAELLAFEHSCSELLGTAPAHLDEFQLVCSGPNGGTVCNTNDTTAPVKYVDQKTFGRESERRVNLLAGLRKVRRERFEDAHKTWQAAQPRNFAGHITPKTAAPGWSEPTWADVVSALKAGEEVPEIAQESFVTL